jgi:hypothetical protein
VKFYRVKFTDVPNFRGLRKKSEMAQLMTTSNLDTHLSYNPILKRRFAK